MSAPTLLSDDNGDFRIANTAWYLDARNPRAQVIVSHAHSDHIGHHRHVVATPITGDLLKHRLQEPGETAPTLPLVADANATPDLPALDDTIRVTPLPYGELFRDHEIAVDLFPAGHVVGSALTRVTTNAGRLLYTGDFRFKGDALTVPPCTLPDDGADVVLMECTYGLPRYRFPPRHLMIEKLCELVAGAQAEGKQPICLCYSLGKAQETARILCTHGFRVSMHGAAYAITKIHEQHGIPIGDCIRYEAGNIEGTVLIAPPHVRNSRMITGIKNAAIFVITGWALDSSAKYRYQAQDAVPISDHADFDELNAFVDAMRDRGTKHFLLTHGFVKEFGRHLRTRGISASPAKPPKQMALFDD